jgi:hypothetical protein
MNPSNMEIEIPQSLRSALRPPTKITVHAHSLLHPSHMEWTVDGRLLASEFGRGRVVDVTEGGSMRDAEPFAHNLRHPAGLLTKYKGNRILVADTGQRAVFDITDGGDASRAPVVFSDVPGPYGLLSYGESTFSTFSSERENGLACMDNSPCFKPSTIRIGGFPNGVRETPYFLSPTNREGECGCWTALGYQGHLLYLHAGLGMVFAIDGHDRYSPDLPIIARGLSKPLGMITHPLTGLLYVVERGSGSVKAIPSEVWGTDMRYIPPVATGFKEPSCVRFAHDGGSMYVCDMAACCIWRVFFD